MVWHIAALGLLACSACVGGSASLRAQTSPPIRCEVPFTVPAGFGVAATQDDRYADHVGVRVRLRDAKDRELQLFFGVPGEFGEGAPILATLTVASGEKGTLFRSHRETWILAWFASGPCGSNAVIGNGFVRKNEFVGVLEEANLI